AVEQLLVRTQCPLDPPDEVEDRAHSLRLGLRIAHERGAQAPVVAPRTFGVVDEARELRRLELDRHPRSGGVRTRFWRQPTGHGRSGGRQDSSERGCYSPVAGSITRETGETLFAGKPPQRACS